VSSVWQDETFLWHPLLKRSLTYSGRACSALNSIATGDGPTEVGLADRVIARRPQEISPTHPQRPPVHHAPGSVGTSKRSVCQFERVAYVVCKHWTLDLVSPCRLVRTSGAELFQLELLVSPIPSILAMS
jgi:hypothetical protein